MRHWMSAQAEKSRMGQRRAHWQVHRGRWPASLCPPKIALRTDVRSGAARIRGTTDHIAAASPAHAGPGRDGMVHRDCLDHPDWQTARSQPGCAVGKPLLHPRWPAEGRSARQAAAARRCCPAVRFARRCNVSYLLVQACGVPSGAGRDIIGKREWHHGPGRAVVPVEGGRDRGGALSLSVA
jgi:hypothetical protein